MESLDLTLWSRGGWLTGNSLMTAPLIDGKPADGLIKLTIMLDASGLVTVNDMMIKSLNIRTVAVEEERDE